MQKMRGKKLLALVLCFITIGSSHDADNQRRNALGQIVSDSRVGLSKTFQLVGGWVGRLRGLQLLEQI
jgi:hypothetical protein